MEQFYPKLDISNLVPSVGSSANDYQLFNKFTNEVLPMLQRNRVSEISQPTSQVQQPRDFLRNPMDVVYKPPVSDQIGARMLGVGPGAITPQDEATNALKGRAIDATVAKNENTDEIARGKLGISADRADVYRFKAENPGIKIIAPKGGNIKAINSATGELVKDFGPTGTMTDSDRMSLEQSNDLAKISEQQKGKESLAEMQARHAQELAAAKAVQNTGTTRTETLTDAEGKSQGTRTTTTKPNAATNTPKVGDIKVFPNGRKGRFDGKGYVPVQ